MKKGIFVALAAMALAIFVVPEAYGNAGPDIDWQFSGSNFNVDADEEGTVSVVNAFAKGQPGTAHVGVRSRIAVLQRPFAGCPDDWFGADVMSQFAVATFNDGSILTAQGTDGFVCTPDGDIFTGVAAGIVTGGTGRFEGASGTWESNSFLQGAGTGITGTLTADLH